ncbi:MgtC/SapB family protein [Lachnoclostridium phytofermentans]|uniref:MgtC/SapB transporter n=1 Tax=Lachnoclostridium phytofermentans (strain ATCC 700394 / DSM 18823 / ISDg) TaxID=357809 RepID=A9KRC1_LACP7|nr:MgtC/SapB family protein [Lachnoclostridium phytofermentans]ABX40589.1 MgtC/SapB transporter [Lachnoclostridium phytofermentans ISDg]
MAMPELLTEVNVVSTTVRLLLALVCGGILGIERGRKKRPAGFRTYMLVCIGSTLVMITSQYICSLYQNSDPARMSAQVISGIGFLGAGTIIVTGRNRVMGLTTAAGLWASACIGLSIGIGFYSGAIIGCILIFFVMSVLHRLDERVISSVKIINLYVELSQMSDVGHLMRFAKEQDLKVNDVEFVRGKSASGLALTLTLKFPKCYTQIEIIELFSTIEGVTYMEVI